MLEYHEFFVQVSKAFFEYVYIIVAIFLTEVLIICNRGVPRVEDRNDARGK